MIETKNSDYVIYKGYYAIAFYAAETDKLFVIFHFGFAVTVNSTTGAAIESAFKPSNL